jgi:dTDP-4-dehydrorhamnose reductase
MAPWIRFGRPSLNVVDDQIGTPTNAVDLAQAIVKHYQSAKKSIRHLPFQQPGVLSWYELCRKRFSKQQYRIELHPFPQRQSTLQNVPNTAWRQKAKSLELLGSASRLGRFFETNYKKSGILNAAFFIVIA